MEILGATAGTYQLGGGLLKLASDVRNLYKALKNAGDDFQEIREELFLVIKITELSSMTIGNLYKDLENPVQQSLPLKQSEFENIDLATQRSINKAIELIQECQVGTSTSQAQQPDDQGKDTTGTVKRVKFVLNKDKLQSAIQKVKDTRLGTMTIMMALLLNALKAQSSIWTDEEFFNKFKDVLQASVDSASHSSTQSMTSASNPTQSHGSFGDSQALNSLEKWDSGRGRSTQLLPPSPKSKNPFKRLSFHKTPSKATSIQTRADHDSQSSEVTSRWKSLKRAWSMSAVNMTVPTSAVGGQDASSSTPNTGGQLASCELLETPALSNLGQGEPELQAEPEILDIPDEVTPSPSQFIPGVSDLSKTLERESQGPQPPADDTDARSNTDQDPHSTSLSSTTPDTHHSLPEEIGEIAADELSSPSGVSSAFPNDPICVADGSSSTTESCIADPLFLDGTAIEYCGAKDSPRRFVFFQNPDNVIQWAIVYLAWHRGAIFMKPDIVVAQSRTPLGVLVRSPGDSGPLIRLFLLLGDEHTITNGTGLAECRLVDADDNGPRRWEVKDIPYPLTPIPGNRDFVSLDDDTLRITGADPFGNIVRLYEEEDGSWVERPKFDHVLMPPESSYLESAVDVETFYQGRLRILTSELMTFYTASGFEAFYERDVDCEEKKLEWHGLQPKPQYFFCQRAWVRDEDGNATGHGMFCNTIDNQVYFLRHHPWQEAWTKDQAPRLICTVKPGSNVFYNEDAPELVYISDKDDMRVIQWTVNEDNDILVEAQTSLFSGKIVSEGLDKLEEYATEFLKTSTPTKRDSGSDW